MPVSGCKLCKGRKGMSTLVAVVFNDESTAFEMRGALTRMQTQYLLEMEDAVVVTRDPDGKTRLHQAYSLTGMGAASGAFWGMLIGMFFLNPFLGGLVGMGAGALAAKFKDVGLDDSMMKEVGQSLKPNTSALFVLLRKTTPDKVLEGLKQFTGKGRVFQSSLNKDDEKALRDVLEAPVEGVAA